MRFAMYENDAGKGVAALFDGVWRGLGASDPRYPGGLDEAFARGAGLAPLYAALAGAPVIDLGSARFLPPLARPSKILCIGLNYRSHAEETRMRLPDFPTVFARFPSSLVGHRGSIPRPSASVELDYEGELVAVIGRRCKGAREDEALACVAGYSVFNDSSVRDYQKRTSQWTLGKNFDGTGAMGPWLVTADELPPGAAGLRVVTRLNGVTVQDGDTADMVFGVASLVSLLSGVMTLEPGDLIVTGTPAGVGMAREPQLWMKPGDEVEVEIEGVGLLANRVSQG